LHSTSTHCQISAFSIASHSTAKQIVTEHQKKKNKQNTPKNVCDDQTDKNTGCHTEKRITDQSFHLIPAVSFLYFMQPVFAGIT